MRSNRLSFIHDSRNKCFCALVTMGFALGTWDQSSAAVVFSDDFSAYGTNSYGLNLNLPGVDGSPHPTTHVRQSGTVGSQGYYEEGGEDFFSQLGNPGTNAGQAGGANQPDYLLLAIFGHATNHLKINEAMANGSPLSISFDLGTAMPPGYTDDTNWCAFRLGGFNDTWPVVGGAGDFAFLYRINKGVQVFPTNQPAVEFSNMASRRFTMVYTNTAGTGSAFCGQGSRVLLYNGTSLLGTYDIGQLTEEYMNFSVLNAYASVDNLKVETGLPGDLDGDGLADAWELAYGFSITDDFTLYPDQLPSADPDHDGYSNLEEATFGTDPNVRGGVPGTLLLETWFNLPGENVSDLTQNPRFVGPPDLSEFVYSAEAPASRAEFFGARMRGYVIAPVTGNYTFSISGDDACELWLSGNKSQFAKQQIASQPHWAGDHEWTKYPTQTSAVIPLIAGKKYYIEAIEKEYVGPDHLEIGWTLPGSSAISVIPGSQLESYAYDEKDPDGDNMPLQWETNHGLDPAVNDAELDPDFDGIPNGQEYANGTNPQVKTRFDGALLHELWWNTPAFSVHSPISEQRRLQPPDQHTLAFSTQGPVNYAEAYTDRYRGYLTAPVSGDYTFWAVGDEETEFWLSTSANKFKKELLVHPGPQIRDFDADLSMKSRVVTLQAGERYYLEILHINHHGFDYCEVAWQVPGGQREIIPGAVLSSYVPIANDQDDDDLPDDWELANGLDPTDNGHLNPKNGAHGDLDGDGLDNATEWKAHTRADLADTDGDGVSDFEELETLGTSALTADVAPFESIAILPGASFTAAQGEWNRIAGKAQQACVRGSLDYPITLSTAGVYELDLIISALNDADVSHDYEIVFSIDGKSIERQTVKAQPLISGHAKILTPWLPAGGHTVRVFVDNSHYFRRITVDQLQLLAAHGPDADANSIPDWVDIQLAKRNSLKAPAKSLTSPVCLEGKARWSEMTTLNGAAVQIAPNERWFANVPLDPANPTAITASLENGAFSLTRQIKWVPLNLLDTPALTLRQGDSLRLTAFTGPNATAAQSVTLSVEGQTSTQLATQPLVHAFNTPGSFPIQISHRLNGNLTTATVSINVVAAPVLESPVCVLGYYREVSIPALPNGVTLQLDDRLEIQSTTTGADGSTLHAFRLTTMDDRPAVFRAGGTTGPILAQLPFRAMRVRSGGETALYISGSLGNDQFDVTMPVLVDGNYLGTSLSYHIFISGVVFDDGSTTRTLLAGSHPEFQWSEVLHFYKIGNAGSVCHRLSVWQGNLRIAFFP